jgi:hypothetical protein
MSVGSPRIVAPILVIQSLHLDEGAKERELQRVGDRQTVNPKFRPGRTQIF